ncbi:hypothetical protein LZ32DRAFT_414020 [Colletotrichum eremochloae]|nr:hypothetical protein LZ32DRAFT_414020 [Colletotrichum eremochloae]
MSFTCGWIYGCAAHLKQKEDTVKEMPDTTRLGSFPPVALSLKFERHAGVPMRLGMIDTMPASCQWHNSGRKRLSQRPCVPTGLSRTREWCGKNTGEAYGMMIDVDNRRPFDRQSRIRGSKGWFASDAKWVISVWERTVRGNGERIRDYNCGGIFDAPQQA